MPYTSVIAERRQALVDIIVLGLADEGLPPWRVHAYPPTTVASPCIWVDMPQLDVRPPHVIAEFPVVLHVDGADQVQLRQFDLVVARVWDALQTFDADTAPTAAVTRAADIGGPTARRYVITATSILRGLVLCAPASALSEALPTP